MVNDQSAANRAPSMCAWVLAGYGVVLLAQVGERTFAHCNVELQASSRTASQLLNQRFASPLRQFLDVFDQNVDTDHTHQLWGAVGV